MKKNRLASLVFGCLLFSCGGPFPGVGENSLLEQANRVETESKVSSQIPFTYQLVKLLETFQGGILAENYAFLKR